MSEWLDIMLGEIRRKTEEFEEAQLEVERRRAQASAENAKSAANNPSTVLEKA